MKLPFALVLSASVIFLSGASGSADSNPSPTSQEIRSDKRKDAPKDVKDNGIIYLTKQFPCPIL